MKKILLFACSLVLGMSAMAQNLLQNSDFGVKGDLISGTKYKIGAPWVWSIGSANIRVESSAAAKEGGNVLVWRGSGNSNYISQPVAAEAGAAYEVTISQVASGNANANFNVGIGTAAGKYDVASGVVRLGTNNDGVKTVKFFMPETVDASELYFTFANTPTNTASSGSDPVTQIDYIKLQAIDALAYAKELAIASLPSAGDPIFGISEDKIQAAKDAINNATSRSEIDAIVAGLTIPALSGEWAILNATNGLYLGEAVLAAESQTATFEKASSGFYIKINDKYINMKGGNNWSMSADATAKTAWTFTLADGKYTIKGPNGLIGTDATTAGSAVYGDKTVANNGYWLIVDLAAAAIESAKGALQGAINEKNVPTVNIGNNAFQYPYDDIQTIQAVIDAAKAVLESETATLADINAQISLVEAIEIPLLNKPEDGAHFAFVLTYDGWDYDNKAITYIANGRNDHGKYNLQYNSEVNRNYAQAFEMTWVEGNKYKMSQIDAEGQVRYISTGIPYGGNTAQIRTTTDASKALVVEILPTATDGKYNLWNTEANQFIGSQDAGVFTVNSHIDFNIVVADPGKGDYINIWPENKYATICSPHAIHLMTDAITAVYTVDGVEENGATLTLTALTLEDNTIPANTPVLLYAENGASNQHAGFGTAYKDMSLTKGLLTGVYEYTPAPAGSYVLQNHGGVVGFYQVTNEGDANISEYKCYLTAPSSARVLTFGEETAINAIDALTSGKAQIFDLNGRKLNSLQKGINIVNGVKILVK